MDDGQWLQPEEKGCREGVVRSLRKRKVFLRGGGGGGFLPQLRENYV